MSKQVVFGATLVLFAMTALATAQDSSKRTPDVNMRVSPTTRIQLKTAFERTPEQMDAFDATTVNPGELKEEPRPRPTMDENLYARLKQQAALAPRMAKPSGGSAPYMQSPQSITKFSGATECQGDGLCWTPPDVAGTIGKSSWVSVSNNVIEIHSRAGAVTKTNSLNGFFGYSTESMFDPRVQYDEAYQRWIVTADAFAESSTVQYFAVAISQTNSATGKWWIYFLNTNSFTGTGSFFDFPMVGLSQDAVEVTANVFGTSSFLGAYLFAMPKAAIYNGLGWSSHVWTGLSATLAPSHQLLGDGNGYAWLASAPGNSGAIYMYALSYPASFDDQFLNGPYTVAGVHPYSIPPAAAQPTSCAPAGANLDTLDNRFQNIGIQSGDLLYQTHTTADFGVPTPRYYIISGLLSFAPTVSVQNDFFGAGSTTDDWNPSIAADPSGNFALNWSDTDPANGVRASMYFADNKSGNPVNSSGSLIFESASCYTGVGTSRWGDYSQISLDPGTGTQSTTNSKIFWITNESIPSANSWSTEVAKMPF